VKTKFHYIIYIMKKCRYIYEDFCPALTLNTCIQCHEYYIDDKHIIHIKKANIDQYHCILCIIDTSQNYYNMLIDLCKMDVIELARKCIAYNNNSEHPMNLIKNDIFCIRKYSKEIEFCYEREI